MPARESDGFLHGDIPYLRIGQGPPLVSIQGLTAEHDVPRGMDRRFALGHARPLADDFTVYVVNRRRGLRRGESMPDLARHVAEAIERDIGEPVHLDGTSTGGSVALQLAVDRPDLVRRLVVVCAAYRLGEHGRALQSEMAQLVREGRTAEAWASVMTAMTPAPLRRPTRPLAKVAAGRMAPADPTDLLVTLEAEDAFDVRDHLHRITAPTLVIGGGRDVFYEQQLFLDTAAGVAGGRAHLFPGWGHGRASTSTATTYLELGFMLAG